MIYEGIRLTPAEIVEAASAMVLTRWGCRSFRAATCSWCARSCAGCAPRARPRAVVVGGIIPEEDRHVLRQLGVTRVYTPKDFRVNAMLAEIAALIGERQGERAA